jgi:hypothetical protein
MVFSHFLSTNSFSLQIRCEPVGEDSAAHRWCWVPFRAQWKVLVASKSVDLTVSRTDDLKSLKRIRK